MTRIRNTARMTATSVAALVLAACGGGGGGSDGAGSASTIDSSNGKMVASRAYAAADALYSTSESITQLVDVKSAGNSSNGVRPNLAEFAIRKLLELEAAKDSSATLVGKVVETSARECSLGGSFVETWNDADNSGTLSSGDTSTVAFTNCVEGSGLRMNGAMNLASLVMSGSDATPSRSIAAVFTFDNFQMAVDDHSATVHGDMAIQAAITNASPYTYDLSISGRSLTVSDGSRSETLASYDADVGMDFTAGTYAYNVAGTVSGTAFPAAITMATPQTLSGNIGAYPTTGVTTATASDGTAVRLTANSATSVTVELDADADGTFESSETMTWAELTAL